MAEPRGLNNPLSGSLSPHKSPHLILRNMQSRSTEMNFDSDSDCSPGHLFSASDGQFIASWNSSIFDYAQGQSSLPVDASLSLSRGHFAKKRIFKQWATSYHQSVQHNVMDEIACVYNRRRYIIAVFDVLTRLARDSRASVAIATADAFALGVVLTRWSALARTRYYFKVNLPVAILFRKCSIAIRVFEALRLAKNSSKAKLEAVRMLTESITRIVANSSVVPWHERIAKTSKLEDLDAKLTLEVKRRAKHRALLGFCIAYNNVKGVRFLVPLVQRLLTSYALKHVVVGFTDFGTHQANLESDILNIQRASLMDKWLFATRAHYITRATRTWLKSRALAALRNAAYKSRDLRGKRKLIEERLRRLRMVAAMSRLFDVIYKRQVYSKACQRFANVIEGVFGRMAMSALYFHAYRHALLNQLQSRMDTWHQQWLMRLTLAAIERYITQKNEKRRSKQVADAHYRRVLACKSFDAMAIVCRQRIQETEAMVAKFVAAKHSRDKRDALAFFKSGIAACKRLKALQMEVAKVHDRFLALAALKCLHLAYRRTRALKREIIEGFYSGGPGGSLDSLSGSGLPFTASGVDGGTHSAKTPKPEEQEDTKARRTEAPRVAAGALGFRGGALDDSLEGLAGRRGLSEDPRGSCRALDGNIVAKTPNFQLVHLQILTEPLPSECQWFLYTLIGATQKANDLAGEYEYEALDLIVRLNSRLSAQDLRQLQLAKSNQIYSLTSSLGNSTDDPDGSTDPTAPEWLKNFLWAQFKEALAGSGRSFDHSAFVDVIPLWRLVYSKHRSRRLLQWISNWRAYNAHRKNQRQHFETIQSKLQKTRRVATLSYFLNLWSQVASAAKEERLESWKICIERLISAVYLVLYKRAHFALLTLRLHSQALPSGASSKVDALRHILDIAIPNCHLEDSIELYRDYSNLKLVRSCLLVWLLHFKWESTTRRNVSGFYRTTFLKKGWNAMYGLWKFREANRENASEAIGSLVVANLAKRHLVAWCLESRASAHYRLLILRKGMLSLRRFTALSNQHKCLTHWNQQRKLAQFIDAWSTAAKVRRISKAIEGVATTLQRRLLLQTMSSLHRNALVHARVAKVESMSIYPNLQQVSQLAARRIEAGILALAINVKIRHLWRRRNRNIASLALGAWRSCTAESDSQLASFCTMDFNEAKSNRHLALFNAHCNAALMSRVLLQWRGAVLMAGTMARNLEAFILQRRIKQGLLALYEHAMEQRWHSLCILRCQMLMENRVLDQKAAIYRWWRNNFATQAHLHSMQAQVGIVNASVATGL